MWKAIAIDDEPIALSILREFCRRRGGLELETFSSPRVGLQRILETRPNIVFLDIELNGVSGIELARQLPASCCLIFTTAFANYALDGFEVNAVDFLHKPYFFSRFETAVEKAEQRLHLQELLHYSESSSRQITLKSDYKTVRLSADRILFIESVTNYVKVHLTDGSTVWSKISLSALEKQLPPGEFLRIHRSFVVARRRITSFSRSEVTLAKLAKPLPVGKTFTAEVVAALETKS
ncbi:MAG: LytR/AlgR family response regulator transcription factor [Alloprevotella sp.]